MQTHQILVLKGGTLGINGGDILLGQDRKIFVIYKKAKKESIVGQFSVRVPDNFDLYGGNAESRKIVTEMLKKGKEIAGKAK